MKCICQSPILYRNKAGRILTNTTLAVKRVSKVKRISQTDQVKLSAGWLIKQAGIDRGYVRGNVGTSSKHALAIINLGGGTAREVVELAAEIKSRVLDRFGVTLTPEPIFVGMKDEG
jgi:UDP-N-acetylenolpyruvoylglucosamine reductase